MVIKRWAVLGIAATLLLLSQAVLAHHGTAIFDMTQSATIKGTVVDYELINPHVQMIIKVEQEGGKTQDWNCLLYTSPSPRDRQKSRMPSSA